MEDIYLRLYLVRHGQTVWNSQRRMQGWENSNLTEKGIDEAKRLGKRLEEVEFDVVYSSPIGRALETAEYISGLNRDEIIKKDGFKEMAFGKWEGLEFDKLEGEDRIQYNNLWNDPENYESIGGENFDDVISRLERDLKDLVKNHQGEEVLLISHGVLIRVLTSLILKKEELKNLWDGPVTPNTSLTIIEFDQDGAYRFLMEGDISHLE